MRACAYARTYTRDKRTGTRMGTRVHAHRMTDGGDRNNAKYHRKCRLFCF